MTRAGSLLENELFAQYKANRAATPSELSEQIPLVKEIITAAGVRVIEAAGYEADDIIGTLAISGADAGYKVAIITGDRDALQLVNPQVEVLLTKKGYN